jgi:hypothetical protein
MHWETYQDPFLNVGCVTLGYDDAGDLSGNGAVCATFAVLSK